MSTEASVLSGKRVLITGGTGSLGKRLVKRILSGDYGMPERVIVFSRDEAKQHEMRLEYLNAVGKTDEVVFENFKRVLQFEVGDVRDARRLQEAVADVQIVVNAAALKQVPTCEYFPFEAVQTNVVGTQNLIRAVRARGRDVEVVVGVSTDKACHPVNVMGMTKAIQERLLVEANLRSPSVRFVYVRYGNVLASRGSVVPLFRQQIESGGPVTLTSRAMTRFFLTLDRAVETVIQAICFARCGEGVIPRVDAVRVEDLALAIIGSKKIGLVETGIRPGEKLDEVLVSDEEARRTIPAAGYLRILPMLPELRAQHEGPFLDQQYCSCDSVLSFTEVVALVERHGLASTAAPSSEEYLV